MLNWKLKSIQCKIIDRSDIDFDEFLLAITSKLGNRESKDRIN